MLKNIIFQNANEEEYKVYGNLARRILEIYLLDYNYQKGCSNLYHI